jgi:hypothetical protein
MGKENISKMLREALGVPNNILKLGRDVYTRFLDNLESELPNSGDDFSEYRDYFYLNGDFVISDYNFKRIEITVEIFNADIKETAVLASMNYKPNITVNKDILRLVKSDDFNSDKVNLGVTIAVKPNTTKTDLIQAIINNEKEYISSFTHELKHAYDNYKKKTNSLIGGNEYRAIASSNYRIPTVDKFFHYSYFIHNIENLVRPSEVASEIEHGNITKKGFINFLASNSTYNKLKEINKMTLSSMLSDLNNEKEEMIKILQLSKMPVPNDDELVETTLNLLFLNLRYQKIDILSKTLLNLPYELVGLFGNSKSKEYKFLMRYKKSLEKFDNYKDFFNYEFEKFKNISEEMMKKISKLYAMAKDDEKVANILTKINSKNTNESIKDWDLYHEIKTKQTIFKDLK